MNNHDLRQFRDIFDEEMTREGFVWRYQMYIHVDFEQYWLIGLWPKVENIGYEFGIQFTLDLFNCMSLESLKAAHSQYYDAMFTKFDIYENFNIRTSIENFRRAYEQYIQKVKPVLHGIRSSYDAYCFRNTYCTMFDGETILFGIGESCIKYLLVINEKGDIPGILNRIKKHQDVWEKSYYARKPPLPGDTDNKFWQLEMEGYRKEKINIEEYRKYIQELERKILENDYGDMANSTKQAMQNMADTLRKSFTKKEIEIMKKGWE